MGYLPKPPDRNGGAKVRWAAPPSTLPTPTPGAFAGPVGERGFRWVDKALLAKGSQRRVTTCLQDFAGRRARRALFDSGRSSTFPRARP